jgi:hypothetical protein
MQKGRPDGAALWTVRLNRLLTLAGLEPGLRLVDHIDAAFAAHDSAIAMTRFQRTERVCDFHQPSPAIAARGAPFGFVISLLMETE